MIKGYKDNNIDERSIRQKKNWEPEVLDPNFKALSLKI